MKGGKGWNLSILGVNRDPWEFYLMCLIIFSKYTTNLKTTISQRSLRNLGLLLLLFEFYNFSFLIDIIDNIINMSISCNQNSHQWKCSIIITWLHLILQVFSMHLETGIIFRNNSLGSLKTNAPIVLAKTKGNNYWSVSFRVLKTKNEL